MRSTIIGNNSRKTLLIGEKLRLRLFSARLFEEILEDFLDSFHFVQDAIEGNLSFLSSINDYDSQMMLKRQHQHKAVKRLETAS